MSFLSGADASSFCPADAATCESTVPSLIDTAGRIVLGGWKLTESLKGERPANCGYCGHDRLCQSASSPISQYRPYQQTSEMAKKNLVAWKARSQLGTVHLIAATIIFDADWSWRSVQENLTMVCNELCKRWNFFAVRVCYSASAILSMKGVGRSPFLFALQYASNLAALLWRLRSFLSMLRCCRFQSV